MNDRSNGTSSSPDHSVPLAPHQNIAQQSTKTDYPDGLIFHIPVGHRRSQGIHQLMPETLRDYDDCLPDRRAEPTQPAHCRSQFCRTIICRYDHHRCSRQNLRNHNQVLLRFFLQILVRRYYSLSGYIPQPTTYLLPDGALTSFTYVLF